MKRRGFTVIEAVIIVVVVAILTTLGFVAYNQFMKPKAADTQTTAAPATVTEVKSTADLDKVTSDLDALDLTDTDDTTALDAQTQNF